MNVCFEELQKDPRTAVKSMLDFIEFPSYRLDCIFTNLEGDFHREHHVHHSHIKLFSKDQIERILQITDILSALFKRNKAKDCTHFFNFTGITDL